jgi:dTDP-4-dehydrorhamnose 3,5-epimerase
MPFNFTQLELPDLILVSPKIFPDGRGFFFETYKKSDFESNGITQHFVQDNQSRSARGVLRGLHYQLHPKAQGKLVRVLRGGIWDVAVDIRKGSPHFRHWCGVELNDHNNQMLYIPPGFAHGFITLSEEVDLHYKCTNEYDITCERGIRWDDPEINISWPAIDPLISDKDLKLPLLKNAELFD